MKNKSFIIFACLFVFLLAGCSKALDEAPGGKISIDEVFSDNDKVMNYLNTCYTGLPARACGYFFWCRGTVTWCDDAWDADDVESSYSNLSRRMYEGNASAQFHPIWEIPNLTWGGNTGEWDQNFQRIRNCAVFIQRAPTATVTDENDRARWIAEAHLLRAYYYTEILMRFGCPLPIVREPYNYDSDFTEVTRDPFYDVVQFIIEDCREALKCEQLPWRITSTSEERRMTKAVAYAIMSRMINYAASPLYCDGENHWKEAYEINKEAVKELEAHGYELYTGVSRTAVWDVEHTYLPNNYAKSFNEYFCNSGDYSATPNDKETIYQLADGYNSNLSNVDGIPGATNYKAGTCPSQELVDAFETTNGKTVLNLAKPYNDEQHLQPNYNTDNELFNPNDPYANRDPRFYATVYYNGAKRYASWGMAAAQGSIENAGLGTGNHTRTIATWSAYEDESGNIINIAEPNMGPSQSERHLTRTAYYQRKFLHPNEGKENPMNGARHKDYRLAEVYLNMAEAAMESGNISDALTYLNKVRARVGMPDVTETNPDALRLRIHNEYRVELALEGNRYFDVRRWTSPDGDLSDTDHWVTAAKITHMKDGSYKYDRMTIKERQCYTNKWLKAPVPLNEVNNMLAISGENWQNPGW